MASVGDFCSWLQRRSFLWVLLSLADTSTSSPNKGWFCVEGRDRRVSLRPGQPRAWISVRALGPKG